MKVLSLLLSSLSCIQAVRLSGQYTSNAELTTKLMQNAKYHSGGSRELENNNDNFEITASHTIVFKSCESMTVEADFANVVNGGDDDSLLSVLKGLYTAGQIQAQQSYVLFDVCLSQYCDSGNSEDRTTFITDLSSFINAFLEFIPTKTAAYCEACDNNQYYCTYQAQKVANGNGDAQMQYGNNYGQDDAVYQGDGDGDNNGQRKLEDYELVEYIDCDQCSSLGCYSGTYMNTEYSLEWIASMSQCQQSDYPHYFNGAEITTGFMCNEDGDGVEIGAFLDADCTLYTNQVAFGNILSSSDYTYWQYSRSHIEFMFNAAYSCYNPSIMYINPYDEMNGNYGDDYLPQMADDYVPAVADWCANAFQGNMAVVDVDTCGGYDGDYYANANAADDYAAADDFVQVYTLAQDDINNGYAVCQALTGMGGSGEHIYDKQGSGAMYKYNGGGKTGQAWDQQIKRENRREAWGIFMLILLIVCGAIGAAYYVHKQQQNKDDSSQQETKKEPLVSGEGEMA